MRATLLATLAMLVLAAGCGKYGPPVRPPAPTYDEGAIYNAGQPMKQGPPQRKQQPKQGQRQGPRQ